MATRKLGKGWRDATLFLTGIGLTIYEIGFRQGNERPTVLVFLAGMVGLPAFLRKDEADQKTNPQDVADNVD